MHQGGFIGCDPQGEESQRGTLTRGGTYRWGIFLLGGIHKVRTQLGGEGGRSKAYRCVQGEGGV